jgi:hypothetical protein
LYKGEEEMKKICIAFLLILFLTSMASAEDPGWPRQLTKAGSTLIYYQPQVDEWKDFSDLSWRMAFSLTPAGGKEVVGVVELQGHTDVDNDDKMVLISNLKITDTHFPSLDPASTRQMDQLVRTFLPPTITVSLYRLVAAAKKPEGVSGVAVNNDPPTIVVSYRPAIMLAVDGEPVLADVPKTKMKFVVNTSWPIFFDQEKSKYYLLVGDRWMTAPNLGDPWSPTAQLPKGMLKIPADPQWATLKKMIPPPASSSGVIPAIFYSNKPAEIILFDGKPVYAKIPGTQLVYSTNTSSYLFLYTATNKYYYLTGGRWFSADSLQGPWSFATMDLPGDFANIPSDNPASIVLASVPGTDEAKDAVLLAQVPTKMVIDPAAAAAKVKVSYGGEPKFEPISGTSLYYATNTQDKVIKVGDVYYLCLQAVWFMSTTAQGPWTVASSVPQIIYSIPPSSPVYNVTYVTQTTTPSGTVECSHTGGYLGAFIVGAAVGAIVANGNGYYYPPYIYRPPYGYPIYYRPPYTYGVYGVAHYNTATGAYGASRTVVGPYGAATRGASYNPYTGTSARYASAATPYGSRTVGQAYNPYTGAYAATSQGRSPTAQWGSSVVSKNGKTAYSQHYSDARGTVGSVQTSSGGKAVGAKTAYGNTVAGKNSSGDMFAAHDGNVYKNTGSGWKSYDNGNWNSVNKPTPNSAQQNAQNYKQTNSNSSSATRSAAAAQQTAQASRQPSAAQGSYNRSTQASSSEIQGLQKEAQSRQRGTQQTQRYQRSSSAAGGRTRGSR